MSLLAPALLAFLALIPVIILIHFLRSQLQRRQVSSVLLWRNLIQDIETRSKLRRPPITLLLLLQILAVLFGALALGRPLFADPRPPQRQVIALIDASASMQSTDIEPTRFAQAKAQALSLFGDVGGTTSGAVIRIGPRAELIVNSRDRAEVGRALDRLEPADGPADLGSAWRLAGALAASRPDAASEVVLLSDASFPAQALPAIPATSRIIPLGRAGNNQAISQIGVRRPLLGGARPAAFVRVTNFSPTPVERRLRALGDGISFQEQVLSLAARGSVDLVFEPPVGTRIFGAQLVGRDQLATDDRAEAVVPQNGDREVLLVSPTPDLLTRALRAVPELALRTVAPADYQGAGRAELVVFENFLPPALPNAPLFIINPPVPSALASARYDRIGYAYDYDPESPVLLGVDLAPAEFGRTSALVVPSWAAVTVSGPDGPLILEGENEGRRRVVFGFDPSSTNLSKLVVFPTLILNAVEWLIEGPEGSVPVGAAVRLPGGLDGDIVGPDGRSQPASGLAVFDATDRVGRYELRLLGREPEVLFVVNLTNERESDVTPGAVDASRPLAPRAPVTGLGTTNPEGIPEGAELWPWLAAIAMVVISVEWWVFCRRGGA